MQEVESALPKSKWLSVFAMALVSMDTHTIPQNLPTNPVTWLHVFFLMSSFGHAPALMARGRRETKRTFVVRTPLLQSALLFGSPHGS